MIFENTNTHHHEKKINIILVLLVSTMITLSCDKDRGRSWPPIPPIAVSVYVEDKYGRDLLDPDSKYFLQTQSCLNIEVVNIGCIIRK